MRGSSRLSARKPLTSATTTERTHGNEPRGVTATSGKRRVLFVCIGNACRSQMAEAFARAYGGDIVVASSAGLSPAAIIPPLTRKVLTDKNVVVGDQFPKGVEMAGRGPFDIVVNMSGLPLSLPAHKMVTWRVRDPIGYGESMFRQVADQIEELVMRLILEVRSGA
jgi:arsenate reductase